jgi:UDP-N-acetyl-D-glucosamine dehydrogenase
MSLTALKTLPTTASPGFIQRLKSQPAVLTKVKPFSPHEQLLQKINTQQAKIAVLGLGYVGLPLALAFTQKNFKVCGIDIAQSKLEALRQGTTDILDIDPETLQQALSSHQLTLSHEIDPLNHCDVIIVCVPTPITADKVPDLSYLNAARDMLSQCVKPGQLIILESTTYPGTCSELFAPVLETQGLTIGTDAFLGYSPERVDPGNTVYQTQSTPKIVSGHTEKCLTLVEALYQQMGVKTVPVRDTTTAELVKVFENTFRAVNIGLVNELAILCHQMGLNVWEVLNAAGSKPFGFMQFSPGPGIGGHCIPVDPAYLSYKAKAFGGVTRFADLASEINGQMPRYVQSRLIALLGRHGKPLRGSKILILGVAYKRDVADWRESPAIYLMENLKHEGAMLNYSDPFVPRIQDFSGSVYEHCELTPNALQAFDAVVIVTDHLQVDYKQVIDCAPLVLDTRNITQPWQPAYANIEVL